MGEISGLLGIVIRMYFNDHEPPHFHAFYGGAEARVRIVPVGIIRGDLPPRAVALVAEWASLHERELMDNWHRLHTDQPPLRIDPLG